METAIARVFHPQLPFVPVTRDQCAAHTETVRKVELGRKICVNRGVVWRGVRWQDLRSPRRQKIDAQALLELSPSRLRRCGGQIARVRLITDDTE